MASCQSTSSEQSPGRTWRRKQKGKRGTAKRGKRPPSSFPRPGGTRTRCQVCACIWRPGIRPGLTWKVRSCQPSRRPWSSSRPAGDPGFRLPLGSASPSSRLASPPSFPPSWAPLGPPKWPGSFPRREDPSAVPRGEEIRPRGDPGEQPIQLPKGIPDSFRPGGNLRARQPLLWLILFRPFTQQPPDWRCATCREMAENNAGPDQRIVLLGRTGNGKSATGNTILGSNVFKSEMSARSPTKTCQREETLWNGRKVVVVDTPGFFDTGVPEYQTVAELVNCMKLCPPGPHVILWVMRPCRFTQEQSDMNLLIKEVFSHKGKNYMIILFTRKEDLQDTTLEEFISHADVSFQELVAHCGHRCLAFNNKAEGEEREAQVAELMRMIDQVVYKNGDATCYTEDMLREDIKHFKEMRGLSLCPLL